VPPVDHAGSRLVPLAGQRLAAVAEVLQVSGDLRGKLAGAMGGIAFVETPNGGGTRFVVKLPTSTAQMSTAST